MEVRSFRVPGWLGPLLVLAALALIPVALLLAVFAGVAALGVSVARALLSQAPPAEKGRGPALGSGPGEVIEADYEVKDEHEKG